MFISTLRAAALVGTLLSPFAMAVEVQESNQFLIELSSGDTSKLAVVVSRAGGSLKHVMPDLGYATAVSENPNFRKNLKSNKSIRNITRDLIVQWTPKIEESNFGELDMNIESLGHLIDPTDAAWGSCQWHNDQVDVQTAWAKGEYGSPSAKVAVLDTGTDPFHQDLVGQIDLANSTSMITEGDETCDFVSELYYGVKDSETYYDFGFHGSFVSGQIAAHGLVTAGIAPDTQIVGVKVLNCFGSGSFGDIIAGIVYAANLEDVSVINMSLGAYFAKNLKGAGPLVAAMNRAVNYASRKGKLVVSAAGNDFADLQHDGNMTSVPAESGNGIATWAGDIDGGLASYSNHGTNAATLGAGGGSGDINSSQIPLAGCPLPPSSQHGIVSVCATTSLFYGCGTGTFYLFGGSGTSFSAPVVSGVAALLDGKHAGALGASELKEALKETADDIGKEGADNEFGHGRVNAGKIVDL